MTSCLDWHQGLMHKERYKKSVCTHSRTMHTQLYDSAEECVSTLFCLSHCEINIHPLITLEQSLWHYVLTHVSHTSLLTDDTSRSNMWPSVGYCHITVQTGWPCMTILRYKVIMLGGRGLSVRTSKHQQLLYGTSETIVRHTAGCDDVMLTLSSAHSF